MVLITRFMVVDVPSPYNAILFRWWIHKIQAIPSTYHQVVRFPTQYGMMELNQEYCPKVPLGLMRPSQHAKDVSRCRCSDTEARPVTGRRYSLGDESPTYQKNG